jgi:hypothetical protein
VGRSTPEWLHTIDDHRVLGRQSDEPPLPRGKARGIKHPSECTSKQVAESPFTKSCKSLGEQLFITATPRLPIGLVGCPLGVSADTLPVNIGPEVMGQPDR